MPKTVLETLADLIRINSINPEWGGPGEPGVAAYVTEFFETAGLSVEKHEVIPGRNNLYIRLPGKDRERCLLFEVHMDTVSVADMTIDPFEPENRDGRMYGRGACDDKGGIAVMMHAVREIYESGTPPPCDILLAIVVDEEHWHRGVDALVEYLKNNERPLPLGAIVAEPTELRVARANKGVLRWRIATRGKAAHSSKPDLGVNAITAMARVILALEEDEKRLAESVHPLVGSPARTIGLIEGGAQINFVPEHCRITIDRRLNPGEKATDVIADCEQLLERIMEEHPGIHVEMREPYRPSDEAMETPENEPVVRISSKVLESIGLEPEPIGVPFGCDCTKLSRAGIPSVIFGPGSIDQAHAAVEYVEIEQVEKALEFYKRIILNFGNDDDDS